MLYNHLPVMSGEVLGILDPKKGQTFVDATLGLGGHTLSWLEACPKLKVIAFDQDQNAIEMAKKNLQAFSKNIEYIHDNFSNLDKHIKEPIDGILFDLGVSSYQIDDPERGFSFGKDGPLDMRMNNSQGIQSVKELLETVSLAELTSIIGNYGEERFAGRIARNILENKTGLETTLQLRRIIEKSIHGFEKIKSVARVFQALRIATNKELDVLATALVTSLNLLVTGGRIVVLSYHSLEDRIVKNTFRVEGKDCLCPPKMLKCVCRHKKKIKILTTKPMLPTKEETEKNSRSRSAKLRAAEKL
ncbi:MAG: 16S rRNA (cytosine(1402)-N(4))-methyltransferase RsmH [Candidatus Saganbacteria bacterium]|nr:16S rRNA (cytosine(1402)-N(4))-methyltransferase RsmH [Candidatus Saganbacteria bacterium]